MDNHGKQKNSHKPQGRSEKEEREGLRPDTLFLITLPGDQSFLFVQSPIEKSVKKKISRKNKK